MRLVLLTLIVTFFSICASSQEVSVYIENRQYNTAFKLLQQLDTGNSNPDLVIEKVDLAINYFITSFMHHEFAFKDLRPDEDLLEIRGSQAKFDSYKFPADSILIRLINDYPENQDLHRSLGLYYFDVHYRYGNQWFIPEDSLISLFKYHNQIALNNGSFDHQSIYIIGYANLLKEEYPGAIEFFNASLELKEDDAKCHYNLAFAYMALEEWALSLNHSHRAMILYDDNKWKGDAARMVAIAYDELGNLPKSLDFYRQSNLLDPNNYYTIKPMLVVTSKVGMDVDLGMHSKDLLDLDPGNPTVYLDLIEVYYSINAHNKLLTFLDRQLIPYRNDTLVKGNIYFYKGVIYNDLKEMENSRASFEKARNLFSEVYQSGHPVFPTIDSYLNRF